MLDSDIIIWLLRGNREILAAFDADARPILFPAGSLLTAQRILDRGRRPADRRSHPYRDSADFIELYLWRPLAAQPRRRPRLASPRGLRRRQSLQHVCMGSAASTWRHFIGWGTISILQR